MTHTTTRVLSSQVIVDDKLLKNNGMIGKTVVLYRRLDRRISAIEISIFKIET